MSTTMWFILIGCAAFISVIFLSRANGSKAHEIKILRESLKKQIEEQEYANKVTSAVAAMSDVDKRKWLQNTKNK